MGRTDHRDFQFGDGSDGLSDHFIEGVIQSVPKDTSSREMKPRHSAEEAARHEEWAANIYSRVDDRPEKKGCSCGSVWVGVFSVLLLLLGLAAFVLGIVEQHHSQILPFCPGCSKLITGIYVAGGILLFIALLGLTAAKTRKAIFGVPFGFLILIMGLAFLCIGFFAVFYGTGVSKLDLLPVWEEAVEHDPGAICTIQRTLNCSGFQLGCCFSNVTTVGTLPDATTSTTVAAAAFEKPKFPKLAALSKEAEVVEARRTGVLGTGPSCWIPTSNNTQPEWVGKVCSATCTDTNVFTATCDTSIQKKIKEHLLPIVGVLLPIGLIMIFTGVAAVRMSCSRT